MENHQIKTIADNLNWIRSENTLYDSVISGILRDTAVSILNENESISPQQAYDTFSSVSGGSFDLVIFARLCKEILSCRNKQNNESDLILKNTVYLRNPLTDRAYEAFNQRFPGLRAIYSHDFKSSCEDVYYDRADSCILPLESSQEGLLMPFRAMLIKYELKVAAVTKIMSSEESLKSFALVTGVTVDSHGDVLEVYVPGLKPNEFSKLLEASAVIGSEVLRINTVQSSQIGLYDHHICFSADSNSLFVIKFLLSAVYPAYIILGQYKK